MQPEMAPSTRIEATEKVSLLGSAQHHGKGIARHSASATKDDGADIIIVDPGSLPVLGPIGQTVVVASRIDANPAVFYLIQQLLSCLRRHRRSLRQIDGFRQFGNDGSGICSHHTGTTH